MGSNPKSMRMLEKDSDVNARFFMSVFEVGSTTWGLSVVPLVQYDEP